MYTLHTRFCTFGTDLYAQSVLGNKISASELRRKFTKAVSAIGCARCWLGPFLFSTLPFLSPWISSPPSPLLSWQAHEQGEVGIAGEEEEENPLPYLFQRQDEEETSS